MRTMAPATQILTLMPANSVHQVQLRIRAGLCREALVNPAQGNRNQQSAPDLAEMAARKMSESGAEDMKPGIRAGL